MMVATKDDMTHADNIKKFMDEAHAKGLTVYFSTVYVTVKVTKKNAYLTRVKGNKFQILQGKLGWVDFTHTKVTAQ